jgi:hypothetical protein
MQYDRASGIAVLLDGPYRDAFVLGTFAQACQKFETLVLVPCKRMVRGHRMKNVEPGLARTSNAERAIESVTARLREIDGA